MTKIKTALFFGSFNPIHNGHTNLAKDVINLHLAEEVWLVVSPNNPLKDSSGLMDEKLRLEMVELAVLDCEGIKSCDIEFSMPKPNYTINTLQVLKEKYPDREFILMIGSDNALIFDKWKDHEIILKNYTLMVYPRMGYDFNEVSDIYPSMILIQTPLYNISSSFIRENLNDYEKIKDWISPLVYQKLINKD